MTDQLKRYAPPVALTIAGSDNSAGAGIQADLKVFSALEVYGQTAVTCVVAEAPGRVFGIYPVSREILAGQVQLSLQTFPVGAVKTGMLHSAELAACVCDVLEERGECPVVVDPVMIASSGDPLIQAEVLSVYTSRLFRLATLVTPNRNEVETLVGRKISDLHQYRDAGAQLAAQYGTAFLLKGGHFPGESARDTFFHQGKIMEFAAPFVPGVSLHGTGCTYSAAITAYLAQGLGLQDAVGAAKDFITRAIQTHVQWECRGGGRVEALNVFPPKAEKADG